MITNTQHLAINNFESAFLAIKLYTESWKVIAELTEGQRFVICSETQIRPATMGKCFSCLSNEKSGDKESADWVKAFIQTTDDAVDELEEKIQADEARAEKARIAAGDLWLALQKANRQGLLFLYETLERKYRPEFKRTHENLKNLVDKISRLTLSRSDFEERAKLAKDTSFKNLKVYTQKLADTLEPLTLPPGFSEGLLKINQLKLINTQLNATVTVTSPEAMYARLEALLGRALAYQTSYFLTLESYNEIEASARNSFFLLKKCQNYEVEIENLQQHGVQIIQRLSFPSEDNEGKRKYPVLIKIIYIPKDKTTEIPFPRDNQVDIMLKLSWTTRDCVQSQV